jgi:hypothetical protein
VLELTCWSSTRGDASSLASAPKVPGRTLQRETAPRKPGLLGEQPWTTLAMRALSNLAASSNQTTSRVRIFSYCHSHVLSFGSFECSDVPGESRGALF